MCRSSGAAGVDACPTLLHVSARRHGFTPLPRDEDVADCLDGSLVTINASKRRCADDTCLRGKGVAAGDSRACVSGSGSVLPSCCASPCRAQRGCGRRCRLAVEGGYRGWGRMAGARRQSRGGDVDGATVRRAEGAVQELAAVVMGLCRPDGRCWNAWGQGEA